MFFGEFHHQLDDKGRFRIPPRFREQLGENPMLIKGFDNCLMLYTQKDFDERVTARFQNADILDMRMANIKRILFSLAQQVVEDKQGRVTLGQTLTEKCGIGKNLVTIGVMDHVEIWDEEVYKKHMESIDVESVLASFSE